MNKHCNIKISWLWLLFIPLLWMSSFGYVYLYVLAMLIFHECMHVLCALFFSVQVDFICIYPFGMCARFHAFGWGHPLKEGIIASAGLFSHLIIAYLLKAMLNLDWISLPFYDYLSDLNVGLVLFNLIPIYPLDGFRIIQSLVHLFFPYRFASVFTYTISILMLIIHGSIWLSSISAMMIGLLSFISCLQWWMHRHRHYQSFYWYRYLHPFSAKLKLHSQDDLYRASTNCMMTKEGMIHESEWLKEKCSKW